VRLTKRVKIVIIIITCVLGFYFGLDIWMKLINKLFCINKVSHASTFDLSDVELDKYDFIWSFIKKKVIGFIGHFKSKKAFLSWLISIPIWVFDFIYNSHIFLYILTNIVVIIVFIMLWISISEDERYKTSYLASKLIGFNQYIYKQIVKLKSFLLKTYKLNNGYCKLVLFLFLCCIGVVPTFLVELGLTLISYITYTIHLESYKLIFNIFKWIILFIAKSFENHPFISWCVFLYLIFLFIKATALSKLLKMHERFKMFIKCETATVNIWNGAPGSHKSNSIVQAMLANTENFIDELEEEVFNFELSYPNFNMSVIKMMADIRYDDYMTKDKVKELIKECSDDFLVNMYYMYRYIPVDTIYDYFFKLYYRGSFNASSIGVIDPYNITKYLDPDTGEIKEYGMTHHLDFDSIRFYKKQHTMFHEEYENLCITEFDKEYSSNDTDIKKRTTEDGSPAFFAIFSHLVRRHGKCFLDWQDKTQGVRRIRAVAGFFAKNKRARYSYAFLIKVIRKPIEWLYGINTFMIKLYRGKEVRTAKKWALRHRQFEYKRNDVSLFYLILKYIGFIELKVLMYFEHFGYFKIWTDVTYDDESSEKRSFKYYIPIMNMYHNGISVYESCQFNRFYKDLRDVLDVNCKGLKNLSYWSSVDPGAAEYLEKVKQQFYAKIVVAQMKDETEEESEEREDNIDAL